MPCAIRTEVPLTAGQVEFHDLALGLSFVNHSQAYAQPESLELITGWLREMGAVRVTAPPA